MKYLPSLTLFTQHHALSLVIFILVLIFFTSSLLAEASRPQPRAFQRSPVSVPINHFHMARVLSGPSQGGIARDHTQVQQKQKFYHLQCIFGIEGTKGHGYLYIVDF
ncbi:hypothetical protein GmHk_14G040463 [Glycine max]|nr:hypothetical protein GmHk_14G040463 [Glycine max]